MIESVTAVAEKTMPAVANIALLSAPSIDFAVEPLVFNQSGTSDDTVESISGSDEPQDDRQRNQQRWNKPETGTIRIPKVNQPNLHANL